MTAQATETIKIDGIEHQMYTEPFADYLERLNPKPKLIFPTTACWRGYYGKWEIKDNQLFLIELEAYLSPDWEVVGKKYFFPFVKGPVKADWFTGVLSTPLDGRSEYWHGGYGYHYDFYDHIEILEGQVIRSYPHSYTYNYGKQIQSPKPTFKERISFSFQNFIGIKK